MCSSRSPHIVEMFDAGTEGLRPGEEGREPWEVADSAAVAAVAAADEPNGCAPLFLDYH